MRSFLPCFMICARELTVKGHCLARTADLSMAVINHEQQHSKITSKTHEECASGSWGAGGSWDMRRRNFLNRRSALRRSDGHRLYIQKFLVRLLVRL